MNQPIITREGHPEYARLARLVDMTPKVTSSAVIRVAKISRLITDAIGTQDTPSRGTITRILSGKSGDFYNVHRIFSAINEICGGIHERVDHVMVQHSNRGVPIRDDNLSNCLCFPRLSGYISRTGNTASEIGNSSFVGQADEIEVWPATDLQPGDVRSVRTIYVEHMAKGLPVRRDKVRAVFTTVNQLLGGKLHEDQELFS